MVVALGYDGHVYVPRDVSGGGKPRHWGYRVSLLYYLLGTDRVVAEKNFGGDMVEATPQASTEASVKVASERKTELARLPHSLACARPVVP